MKRTIDLWARPLHPVVAASVAAVVDEWLSGGWQAYRIDWE